MTRPTNAELEERAALRARGLKPCRLCKRTLPLADFGNLKSTHDGLQTSCKPCTNKLMQTYSKSTRERMGDEAYLAWKRIAMTASRTKAIEKIGVYAYGRKTNLRKYGLTPDEYDAISERQGGRCASCGEVPPPHSRSPRYRLEVDHDHKTRKTRDLLCHGCNLGIGAFEDSPRKLRLAMTYLRKHGIHL